MICQELDSILYAYLDGEFQPEERLDVEAHLTGCAECARRVHEEARMLRSLRRAARQAVETTRAPDSLRSRIQGGIRQEQRHAQQSWWLRASAAALAVLTAGGTWLALQPEQDRRFMEDAARRHAKKLPVEVTGASHEVEAWFDGKLDHRVAVPQLPNARLSGARISNVTDRPAAYISYERNTDKDGAPAKRIGLFVFDDAHREVQAPPLPSVQMGSSLGYNVAVWREGEVVYELVTDLDETDIRRMLAEQGATGGKPSRPVSPDVIARPVSLQP